MAELLELLRERSFRRGEFRLASGRTSDFFIDCKTTVLRADGHRLVGEALLRRIHKIDPDVVAVAGVALGGCSLASSVALTSALGDSAPLDAIYVRKAVKGHGTGKRVEGADHLVRGSKVVLVEDTVTTGGSSLRALEPLREAGLEPVAVLAVVDRLEGARGAFEQAEIRFESLYTREDFV